MSWRSLRRRLERLERLEISVVTVDPNETPQQRLVRLDGFESPFRPATEEARTALEKLRCRLELDDDPPDTLDRMLARKIAKLKGELDPFGTDGMSEGERRAWDWADYREKERRREADRRVEGLDA
jgi:hypothetical protein